MDFNLSKEEQLIQQAAREFAERAIVPVAEEIYKTNQVPANILQGLGDLGMFGIPFPEEYGGGNAGFLSYILALEQISKACSGVGVILSVNSLGLAVINALGTEEQKQKYMPEAVAGQKICSFAMTEPATATDYEQLATTVTKDGDFYILNGTKRFITNAGYQGPMVVVAKDIEVEKTTAFIIDKFCEGYSVSEPWEKIGAHGGPLYDVYFNNVRVPAENMLGKRGGGLWTLKIGLVYGKIGLTALFLGQALASYEEGVNYAKTKMHRGEAIADKFEHIKISIADMAMKYDAIKWYAYHLGWAADNYKDSMQLVKEAAFTKVFAADTAIDIARIAMGIHGSYGLMKDYKISRLWGDVIMGPQVEGVAPMLKVMGTSVLLNS